MLSGLTVTCASSGQQKSQNDATAPVLAHPEWSETLASGETTGQSAKSEGAVFHMRATTDCYVAIGPVPDTSLAVSTSRNSARIALGGGDVLDVYVHKGDKLKYLEA